LKNSAYELINPATGFLNTLTADTHFYSLLGQCLLNKEYFNIIKRKHFTLTNYGAPLNTASGQSQYGTALQWNWELKPNVTIKAGEAYDRWSQHKTGPTPPQSYYLLVFNDNSALDAESPTVTLMAYNTFTVSE